MHTNVDIFAITETWLNVNDDTTRRAACPEGYYLADHPRSTGRGGGTALLYRDSLAVKKIEAWESVIGTFGVVSTIKTSQPTYCYYLPTAFFGKNIKLRLGF